MSGDKRRTPTSQSQTLVRSGLVVLGVLAVAGIAYTWWYTQQEKNEIKEVKAEDVKEKEKEKTPEIKTEPPKPIDLKNTTQSETLELLKEIRTNQKQMTELLDRTVEEISKYKLTVLETYQRILNEQPADPLDAHGLSIQDFDSLLERFSSDQAITNMVMEILQGGENNTSEPSTLKQEITVDDIIKINSAMFRELGRVVDEFERLDGSVIPNLDTRAASVAAQALVGAFISSTFNVSPEDVEAAIAKNQNDLKSNEDFFRLNMSIQSTMNRLVSKFV